MGREAWFAEHDAARLRRVRWWHVSLPLRAPLRHATADATALESIVVAVEFDDGGPVGHAEVRANGTYATREDAPRILTALHALEQGTGRAVGETLGSLRRGSRLAAMAVDVAAWDAIGKRARRPFASLLLDSGEPPLALPTHGAIAFGSEAQASSLAERFRAQGLRRIKVRIGGDPELDARRLSAVRRAAGDDIELLVDANGGWSPAEAVAALPWLAEAGVAWFEQPAAELDGVAIVAAARRSDAAPRIRVDESVSDAASIEAARRAGVHGVHLKLEKVGTVRRLAAAVAEAGRRDLEVALGQMDQGRLGCAATANLAAGLGVDEAELWGFANVAADVAGPLELVGGELPLPLGPGLGMEVDLPPEPEGTT